MYSCASRTRKDYAQVTFRRNNLRGVPRPGDDAAGNVRKSSPTSGALLPIGNANTSGRLRAGISTSRKNSLGLRCMRSRSARKFGSGTDLHSKSNTLRSACRRSPGEGQQGLSHGRPGLHADRSCRYASAFGREVTYYRRGRSEDDPGDLPDVA